ncbi:MAG: zf-HC2 domain-containing protein [Clostridia bacterium]|nr:zf-HC2 domain-containing protein [Clostridia bacterium]MBQ7296662.1 zf-HC2 domain-containing protein [Clostridia bacterium]
MSDCGIVKDLLPLYADGVCSIESKKLVSEHLADCESCQKELESYELDVITNAADEKAAVKKFKKRTEKKVAVKIISIILVVAIGAFGIANAVWYFRYAKPFDKFAEKQNEYMAKFDEETSRIEAILGENNSYAIDTEKYENLAIYMRMPEYLDNDGVIQIVDGKNETQEIRTDIEVRLGSNGDCEFLVNLMYDPVTDEDFYWPCFVIDENMNLILTDVEEYVNKKYKYYMNNRTEEEAKAVVREMIEEDNAEDQKLYDEYYDTVRDLMIVLHEALGIGNVTA